ncbi:M48 family metallopeptidase [Orenia marismortui]|uniref:YgjP-like metallopeptidase domain-containing protein n=1 Tax=Orenia marismortui TaxID=46469 RepID=A0A4R8H0L2_9FIRM|nr:SprT family zinc-dependent metalloprotease [Orenia marismortui]TDX52962.1 hypothetical protein C7959_10488 [Orenia marismortui]
MEAIKFGNSRIEYDIVRSSRRKTVGIIVDPQDGVIVRVPKDLAEAEIATIVKKKGSWITEKQRLLQEVKAPPKPKEFMSGEKLMYLGRRYRLKVVTTDETNKVEVGLIKGKFIIKAPLSLQEDNRREAIRGAVIDWYKEHAKNKIKARVNYYAPKLDVEPNLINVKEQKKRWGSCSSLGNLNFNWKIIMAPMSIVDYIVVHELAHLRHHNHSSEFWELVEAIISDYNERKEWLRVNGRQLALK